MTGHNQYIWKEIQKLLNSFSTFVFVNALSAFCFIWVQGQTTSSSAKVQNNYHGTTDLTGGPFLSEGLQKTTVI